MDSGAALSSGRPSRLSPCRPSNTAPITFQSIVCFAIQVVLNMSVLSLTAFACFVWCVPSTILLGLAASLEATVTHSLLKRARTRLQAATSTGGMQGELLNNPVVNADRTYGLGAAAA
ncbi:hypothetical protein ABBQ32_002164 [Trebouxia sp. C0010 RCD-2024]